MHILPYTSRRKVNKTMKYSQLIKYNIEKHFFLKNHTQNVVEKISPDPSLKNQN